MDVRHYNQQRLDTKNKKQAVAKSAQSRNTKNQSVSRHIAPPLGDLAFVSYENQISPATPPSCPRLPFSFAHCSFGWTMASLRREVLGGYRRLMRVRLIAFKDDSTVLEASKQQLRTEFNKNKGITDPSKIGQSHCRVVPSNRR